MKPKEGDLVYIEWMDAINLQRGWKDEEIVRDLTVHPITSVGRVFKSTKEELVIASHFDLENENVQGEMCIPKCSIKKIRRMKWV